MVKMSKIDNFLKLFFKFEKKSLSWFYIKSHPFIHCHIYALKNGNCQDELSITKGVPWGENDQLYIFCKFDTIL